MDIGLDFDGVIVKTPHMKSLWAKKLFGVSVDPYMFGTPYITRSGLLQPEEYRRLKHFIYNDKDIGLHMEAMDGVLDFIPALLRAGHRIEVVTSREGVAADIACSWLARYGLDIPVSAVGVGKSKKTAVSGKYIFVDDSLRKLYQVEGVVPHLFLFSWGYNQEFDESGIAKRVYSWHDLYRYITVLAERYQQER